MELLPLDENKKLLAVVRSNECLGEVGRNGRGYNWTSYKTLATGHSPSLPKAIQQLSSIASTYGAFRAIAPKRNSPPDGEAILCFGQSPVVELGKAIRYFEKLLSAMPEYYILWSRGGKKIQVWHKGKQCWVDVR